MGKIIKKVIIVIAVIGLLLLGYFLFLKKENKTVYELKEEEMVSKAKEYVINHPFNNGKEVYLDVNKLGIDVGDSCQIISGIIYNGQNYTPYLVCDEYRSNVINQNDKIESYIHLNGDEIMIIPEGISFIDPGYTSNFSLNIYGQVQEEEGIYNLYYNIPNSDNTAMRKVIVINSDPIKRLFPTLTLQGDPVVYVVENKAYNDELCTANDYLDGDISNKIIVQGNVDTSKIGEYTLKYIVTNSKGYTNSITRIVNVVSSESELFISSSLKPSSLTNKDVTISLNISSDDYEKIVYPDGSEGRELEYVVHENGVYHFSVYDKLARVIEKDIEVTNIDKTKPKGTCQATIYFDRTEVEVTITSKNLIKSYQYDLNNKLSGVLDVNKYIGEKLDPKTAKVKVKVKDVIDNESEINCTIVDESVRKVVTDSNGKNCLEGYICYVQFDFTNGDRYPFCPIDDLNTCGSIARTGCSITSLANAVSVFGLKSRLGNAHTPYTLWDEVYPINNKNVGSCWGGCSAWQKIRTAAKTLGLSASSITRLDNTTANALKEHLKKGYPVILHAGKGPYASGNGHYLSLLGIRDDGYVFLSDSANRSGTANPRNNSYIVDTWVSVDRLISGHVDYYVLIGPKGMF